MRGITSLYTAIVLIAGTHVYTDAQLRSIMPVASLSVYMSVIAACSILTFFFRDTLGLSGGIPGGGEIIGLIVMGLALFFAEGLVLWAYHQKISLLTITTAVMTLPAVASILKFIWSGGLPSGKQALGYVVVALGMYIATSGAQE